MILCALLIMAGDVAGEVGLPTIPAPPAGGEGRALTVEGPGGAAALFVHVRPVADPLYRPAAHVPGIVPFGQ